MLSALLAPKRIAVVGASRSPGKVGHALMANLIEGGFAGEIIPINPHADEIMGRPCRRGLGEVEGTLDLVLVAVPPEAVLAVVQEAVEANVSAIVIVTAGFKETGTKGAALEGKIAALCRQGGVQLLGPNCIGLVNAQHRMNATFAPVLPPPGSISMISQSGALCVALLDAAAQQGIGLGKVVSLGNKAGLSEIEFLRALAADGATRVIVGYLESIADGRRFLDAAEEAARVKPVVLLKAGSTQAGARAASSHTGSLSGADLAYGAAFRRSGVLRVTDLEALFDYARAFAHQPLPAGRRLTILTNAGGAGILAADAAEAAGWTLGSLSPASLRKLKALLPANAALHNPVDVIGDADPDRFVRAFRIAQADRNTDAVLMLVTPQNMTQPLELARKLAAAHRHQKPLLTSFMGGTSVEQAVATLTASGIPNYPVPERAVRALQAMYDYSQWRRLPTRVTVRFPVNRHRADRIILRQTRLRTRQVAEVEAKEILRAYGFRTLPGEMALDQDDAVEAAQRIGFPVVMKIVSPDIVHKSDMGGVILNLANADQVRDAYDVMQARVQRRAPRAVVRGIYLERMGRRGREIILGMHRDPQFGPMLMFGLGGIFVEVLRDVSFHLSPITAEEAMQMLRSTRSYALLQGARGEGPVDLAPIVEGLQRLSQLAADYPVIQELDINPFVVTEMSGEAYVADARMTLAETEGTVVR